MNKISIPPLSEYYNFDRLEDAARELHLNTEEPFEDALTDAIFSVVIQKIIEDYNLTPQDAPADYRDLLE